MLINYDQLKILQSVPSKISAKSLTATIEQQVRFDEQTNKCYPLCTIKQIVRRSAELFDK